MEGLEEKNLQVPRGFTYHYYVTPASAKGKDSSKPALLIQHGWPDSAHLWTQMLPVLNTLPNRLLIPDMLGYGGTSKPTDPKQYAFNAMTQDLIELVDAEGIDKVVSVGHDWGAGSAQRFYNFHSDRTLAVILLNVAYLVPNKEQPFDLDGVNAMTKQFFGYPIYAYWYTFTAPDAPELFNHNLDRVWEAMQSGKPEDMKAMFCEEDGFRKYLNDKSIPSFKLKPHGYDEQLKEHWKSMISAGGFEAPFCWYRCMVDNHQWESDKMIPDEDIKIDVPVLFIACTGDIVCRPDMISVGQGAGLLPDLKVETFESGHWIPLEKPNEVANAIKAFVGEKGL